MEATDVIPAIIAGSSRSNESSGLDIDVPLASGDVGTLGLQALKYIN